MSETPDAWGDWRRDHAAALAALQDAQRVYHRDAVQGAAQSRQSAAEQRKSALEALDRARARLDEVRARMPRH